ncbi:MAG: YciI family protein [Thermomicrobiales bacterium]
MLMIYHNPEIWETLTTEEQQAVMSDGGRRWQDLTASGEIIMGEPLAAPGDARVLRVRNGSAEITDGPFAETKEQFVGFLILDVASEERAVEIAQSWPDARCGALVVRQIHVENAK